MTQGLDVLVVAADSGAAGHFGDGFTRNGFKVRLTGDPNVALQVVIEDSPDVILLDFAAPEVDGIALARSLGGTLKKVKTPFLVVAANVHGTNAQDHDAAGIYLSLCGNTSGLLVGVLKRFREFLDNLHERRDGTESEREFSVPTYR